MNVLVLGGNRYIGLSLVFELARRGHAVTVVNSHVAPLPEGARRIHADRRQPGALEAALSVYRDEFDVVFDNTAYTPEDVAPLVELFRGRIRQFVFTSSVAVYRRSDIHPIREGFRVHQGPPRTPFHAYGVGKVETESSLLREHETSGFPVTNVRVTHTVGPRSPLGTREPAIFAKLEAGRPILLPGQGFPFVHLIHIDDVARLMASLIGNPSCIGETYNAAGAEVASIRSCIRIMGRVVGVEPEIVEVPLEVARSVNPPLVHWGEALTGGMVFSIDKALRHLDWEPELGLEAAYRDSYEWFATEGRGRYELDFSHEDELRAQLV